MTNTNSMMINPTVASHIAYLINHADCAEIIMRGDNCKYGDDKYKRYEAQWALSIIRLAEYGIELPSLDIAQERWVESHAEARRDAELSTRTLEDHMKVEA